MEPNRQIHGDAPRGPETHAKHQTTNRITPHTGRAIGATTDLIRDTDPISEERALTGEITRLMRERAAHGETDPATITNDVGMTTGEVRARSKKLDALLTDPLPEAYDYEDADYADMATVRLLKLWRFPDPTIGVILHEYRDPMARIEPSENPRTKVWWNYIPRTILNTKLTDVEPFDKRLMRAYMEEARENDGRPTIGVDPLRRVYHALIIMGKKEVKVRDVVESDLAGLTADSYDGKAQQVRRALDLLVRTGAMTKEEKDGLSTVYEDNGLRDLSIPPIHFGL